MSAPTDQRPLLHELLALQVPGKPASQGSMSLWRSPVGTDHVKYPPHTVEHRNLTVGLLQQQWGIRPALVCPVTVSLRFYFPRPKSHYRTGRFAQLLRADAPALHTSAPDLDKLVRLVCDALTIAGVWADDSLATDLRAQKRYAPKGLTHIHLYERTPDE